MKNFIVTFKINGKIDDIKIEADDREQAIKLGSKHGKVINIKPDRMQALRRKNLKPNDRQILLQRMAAMLTAKVPASTALKLLEKYYDGAISTVSGRLLKVVEQGSPDLGAAIEKIGHPDFPSNTIALIKAGTKGGDTADALTSAAEFENEMEKVRRNGGAGLGVASVYFIAAAISVFGTTRYLAPWILNSKLIEMAGDNVNVDWALTLGSVTEILMGIMTLIFIVMTLLGTVIKKITPISADKLILKIPLFKDVVLAKNNYITMFGLAKLTASGVKMEQSLKLAYESTAPGKMKSDLEQAHKALKKGSEWTIKMESLHPTDRASLGMSEDRVATSRALNAIAEQYKSLYIIRVGTLNPVLKFIAFSFLVLATIILFGVGVLPMMQVAENAMKL